MDEYQTCQMDFLEACSAGDKHKIMMMLGSGRIDTHFKHRINGWTGLHWASRRGHLEIVNLLLKFGFDANSKAKDGRSPTDVATEPKVKEVLLQYSQPPPDESSSETMVQLSHDAPVKESSNENNNGLEKGDMQSAEGEDNLGELPPKKKSRTNSFDFTTSPPPASPTTPTRKQEHYSYGRRDSVDRTRFLLVRTSHEKGKETFRRITLPGGGSVEMMKSTIERTLRMGKVAQVFTLPDRVLIETKQQIGNFGDSQKIDVVFEDVKQNLGNRRKGSLKETRLSESARIKKHLASTGKAVSMSDENMMNTLGDTDVVQMELESGHEASPKASECVVEVSEEESTKSAEQLRESDNKDSILSSYEVLPPSQQVDDMQKDEGSCVELDTTQESGQRIELKHSDEAEHMNAAPVQTLLHNSCSSGVLLSVDTSIENAEDMGDMSICSEDVVDLQNDAVTFHNNEQMREEQMEKEEKEKEREEKQEEKEKEKQEEKEKEEEVVAEEKEEEVQEVAQDRKDSGDVVLDKDLLEEKAKDQDKEEIPEVKQVGEIKKVEETEAIKEEVKEIPKEVLLQAADEVPEAVCVEKETKKETQKEAEKETEKEIEKEAEKEAEKETEKDSAQVQPMTLLDNNEVNDLTKESEDLVKEVQDLNITSEITEQEDSEDKSEALVSGSETEREEIPEAVCIRKKSKAQEWLNALVGDERDPQRQMKIALLAAGLVGVSTGIAYYIFIKIH